MAQNKAHRDKVFDESNTPCASGIQDRKYAGKPSSSGDVLFIIVTPAASLLSLSSAKILKQSVFHFSNSGLQRVEGKAVTGVLCSFSASISDEIRRAFPVSTRFVKLYFRHSKVHISLINAKKKQTAGKIAFRGIR